MTPFMVHFPSNSTGALTRRIEDADGRELEIFFKSGRPPNQDYKPPDFLSLAKPSGDPHGHSCAITVAFLIVRKKPPRKLIFSKHMTRREVAQSLHKQAHYVFSNHDQSPHGKLLLIHRKSITNSHQVTPKGKRHPITHSEFKQRHNQKSHKYALIWDNLFPVDTVEYHKFPNRRQHPALPKYLYNLRFYTLHNKHWIDEKLKYLP
jgi:hypothetical protein